MIKLRFAASLLIAASLYVAPSLRADDAPAKEEKTPLAKDMDKMGKAFRVLRKQASDASKNDSSLELIATMKAAAQDAVQLKPAWTADKPEADQAKFVADYQAKMKQFLDLLDQAAAAFKAGDNATAAKLVGQLNQGQREGHKEFRKPEKD